MVGIPEVERRNGASVIGVVAVRLTGRDRTTACVYV